MARVVNEQGLTRVLLNAHGRRGWASVKAKDGTVLLEQIDALGAVGSKGGHGEAQGGEAQGGEAGDVELPLRFRAMFDFDPEQEGDLMFRKGDVLVLLKKPHEHWWEGYVDGSPAVRGAFPYNYVQQLMIVKADHDIAPGCEITVELPGGWNLQVLPLPPF